MRKFSLLLLVIALAVCITGCGKSNGTTSGNDKTTAGKKATGIADVCNYFPKELIETAINKPIVKVETPFVDNKSCFYYTQYSETFDHTPYGDKPGGTQVVAVYDDEDFAKDKISNEKSGSKYTTDPSIVMDNYVVRNNANKIWQVVLILGNDKYLRIHFVHQAINGDELFKIGQRFAEKIKNGK